MDERERIVRSEKGEEIEMGVKEEGKMGKKGTGKRGGVMELEDLETREKGTKQRGGRVGEGVEMGVKERRKRGR